MKDKRVGKDVDVELIAAARLACRVPIWPTS